MKARIQSVSPSCFLVDVVCSCGLNRLANEETGERSFKHPVHLASGQDVTLVCDCGKKYVLHPQNDHFHILD